MNKYINKYHPDHPRSDSIGIIREHVLIAEKAMGKTIPKGAVVHHSDNDKSNNDANNLVVCESHQYHAILHARELALKRYGNPNHRICFLCGQHDDLKNLIVDKQLRKYHRLCYNRHHRLLQERLKEGK